MKEARYRSERNGETKTKTKKAESKGSDGNAMAPYTTVRAEEE